MLKYLIITILMLYSSLSAGYYGEIASLEHDTALAFDNSLMQVDSDTYALAYAGTDSDGFIATFTISADGSTITEVASLEHDTALAFDNSLVQVDSDTYALAYRGSTIIGRPSANNKISFLETSCPRYNPIFPHLLWEN